MSDELLVRQCAPTLAGLKAANLFFYHHTVQETQEALNRLNRLLNPKGVCLTVLKVTETGCLVYVYRPRKLEADLSHPEALAILESCGYHSGSLSCLLAQLSQRLAEAAEFPHEIGLFLGYPPADVAGFIRHQGQNFKCSGLWKVYSDEELAQKLFGRYRKCTQIYTQKCLEGRSLQKLTVAA